MLRRSLSAAALLAIILAAPALRAQDEDDWFGEDKALHYGVSIMLASGGYGGCALACDSVWLRLATGACLAGSAGVGKELVDMALDGHFSWKDMTWNGAGILTGLFVAWSLDQLPAMFAGEEAPAQEELEALPEPAEPDALPPPESLPPLPEDDGDDEVLIEMPPSGAEAGEREADEQDEDDLDLEAAPPMGPLPTLEEDEPAAGGQDPETDAASPKAQSEVAF